MSAAQLIEHYGRVFRVLAAFPEADKDAANAYMMEHPEASLLCIRDGMAYLASDADKGQSLKREPIREAAPAMLEALCDALPYVEDLLSDADQLACFKPGIVQKHAAAIRAAITKAEGGAA